ncbi:His Kinase A (phospho-acceptor) domain-containing protein [Atopomonas hussainii]|uniref:histidine kinase n=1 Tax=Atopomonas hussainii TaxID=1429083 RepID=A0A1H7P7Z3_9GAMM|nr:HAMP domain-containing sensor histidine kinase [Atopomonas hussainii]SEL31873.1 His Kinase A (phospho-acceptor) domain-containing protein [Atopomonas hussainii]
MSKANNLRQQHNLQAGLARTLIGSMLIIMPIAALVLWLGDEPVRAKRAVLMYAVMLPPLLLSSYLLMRLRARGALLLAWLSTWLILSLTLFSAGTVFATPMPALVILPVALALSGERLLSWLGYALSAFSIALVAWLEAQQLIPLKVPTSLGGIVLGCFIALLLLGLLLRNMSRHVIGLYQASVDNSARLERLTSRLELALKAGHMCYFRLNPAERSVVLSPNAQAMLHSTHSRCALEQLPGFDPHNAALLLQQAEGLDEAGFSEPIELELNGPEHHLWARVFLIREHDKPELICALQDISAEKQLAQSKSQFAAMVSHELRTPLTALLGSIRLLHGLHNAQLDAQGQQIVDLALRGGERLAALVNDILDFEKLQSERLQVQLSQQSINAQIHAALETLQPLAVTEQVRLGFNAAEDYQVLLDSGRTQQVLVNLLANAIRFSPAHSTVQISVSATPNGCRITVSDQGPGIPLDFQDKLFQPFTQAHNDDTRQTKSTGLGLAISQKLMHCMGGELSFFSKPGQGAQFYADFVSTEPASEEPCSEPA